MLQDEAYGLVIGLVDLNLLPQCCYFGVRLERRVLHQAEGKNRVFRADRGPVMPLGVIPKVKAVGKAVSAYLPPVRQVGQYRTVLAEARQPGEEEGGYVFIRVIKGGQERVQGHGTSRYALDIATPWTGPFLRGEYIHQHAYGDSGNHTPNNDSGQAPVAAAYHDGVSSKARRVRRGAPRGHLGAIRR